MGCLTCKKRKKKENKINNNDNENNDTNIDINRIQLADNHQINSNTDLISYKKEKEEKNKRRKNKFFSVRENFNLDKFKNNFYIFNNEDKISKRKPIENDILLIKQKNNSKELINKEDNEENKEKEIIEEENVENNKNNLIEKEEELPKNNYYSIKTESLDKSSHIEASEKGTSLIVEDIILDVKKEESNLVNELNEKKNNLEKKENEYNQKIKLLEEKEEKLNQEEYNAKIREKNLLEKEIEFKRKEDELKQKEINIMLREDELNKKNDEINSKKNEFKHKEIIFKEKEDEWLKKIEELEKQIKILKNEPILVGLNNIEKTGYMNSIIQCLANTNDLSEYFLKNYNYEPDNYKKLISNEFYKVILNLWDINNSKKSFPPSDFKEKLIQENLLFYNIDGKITNDLINFLIEKIHNELNIINDNNNFNYISEVKDQIYEAKMLDLFKVEFQVKYNSIISRLFYGIIETRNQCQNCKIIKYNFQIYSFIEFPLEKVNQYCINSGKRVNYNFSNFNNEVPVVDLYECFEYYSINELMIEDNQMYCNICKSCCDASYGVLLYSLPNYLIIKLNRGRGKEYECKVNFPEQLDLMNFVTLNKENTVFELYGVICYFSENYMSGHFIAFCKNKIDKKWYKYNDSMVSLCSEPNEYRKSKPYILLYQIKNY